MSSIPRLTTFCPAKAPLTERNLPDQSGKVFIVTGGSGGLGQILVTILYQHNANVYIAARSKSKTDAVINEAQRKYPASRGQLHFLPLILDDLTTVKACAEEFLSREKRLDVLWNNAGVMVPPQGSKTKQGYELQYGVNNLAHFLLTWLLRPVLEATARASAIPDSVRVIWVSSSAADGAPNPPIDFSNMDYKKEEGIWSKYSRSKAASAIHAVEFARRTREAGVVSLALNPGNFVTNLQQNMPAMQLAMFKLITSEPENGAYTELFAGLSPDVTHKDAWVSPFGKVEAIRKDFLDPKLGQQFWEWSEVQIKPYL